MSLEKNMYFNPNRFFVDGNRTYVSFNIAVIPVDMKVTDMSIHVPIQDVSGNAFVSAHSILTGWDEELMKNGYRPPLQKPFFQGVQQIENGEIILSIGTFADDWRFDSYNNHGLCIISDQGKFTLDKPPYLLVVTE